jgi:hypothetical protein
MQPKNMHRFYLLSFLLIHLIGQIKANTPFSGQNDLCDEQSLLVSQASAVRHAHLDIRYGLWKSDFGKLNQGFSAIGYQALKDQVQIVGASFNCTGAMTNMGQFVCHLDYDYFLPFQYSPISACSYRLSGYAVGFGMGKDIFPNSEKFDLVLSLGFQTGRLKMLWSDVMLGQNKSVYNNPFFSPLLMLQPRIVLGFLSLGGRIGYQYDISKGDWRHEDKSLNAIGNSYMTGYTLEGMIGFKF